MLEVKDISKTYNGFCLQNIKFSVNKGDYFIILGESGAGKSIILEIIAGLVKPDKGHIILDSENITQQSIQKRQMGLVFQDYAVFPHKTVFQNIAYPLYSLIKEKKSFNLIKQYVIKQRRIKNEVIRLATEMSIEHLLYRYPNTLSGGELQRVALARTLALKPKCLLLDEPLSSLDVQLRDELRSLLRKINKNGQTIIHVTHEYKEAITLANKIGIINKGKIIQTGTTKEVFHNPKSKFVANFTGIKNFYNAQIISSNKILLENKVEIVSNNTTGNKGFVMLRAEDIIISLKRIESSLTNNLYGKIIEMIPSMKGVELIIDVKIKIAAIITSQSVDKLNIEEGKNVWLSFKATAINYIDGS